MQSYTANIMKMQDAAIDQLKTTLFDYADSVSYNQFVFKHEKDPLCKLTLSAAGIREMCVKQFRFLPKGIKVKKYDNLREIDEIPYKDFVEITESDDDTKPEVGNHLFISGVETARKEQVRRENKIHAILSLGKDNLVRTFQDSVSASRYLMIAIDDRPYVDISKYFD